MVWKSILNRAMACQVLWDNAKTNYFVLLNEKLEPNENIIITPTRKYCRFTVNSFPQYIGYKENESSDCPVIPYYVIDFNEKEVVQRIKRHRQLCGLGDYMPEHEIRFLYERERDRILKSFPLTFTIERPDFVEDKECLRIYSVEDSNFNLLSSNNFILSPYSLKDTDCYWLDSGIFSM